jgi:diacylglycerol O-acyltransferase
MAVDLLSAEDARILRLESATIAGHMTKVIVLDPAGPRPTLEALRARIAARLERAPRLACRLGRAPRTDAPAWVADPAFDVAAHVRTVDSPLTGDRPDLPVIVAGLVAERLDRARPLWTIDLVDPGPGEPAARVRQIGRASCRERGSWIV